MKTVLLELQETNANCLYYIQNAGTVAEYPGASWSNLQNMTDSRLDVLVPGELVRTTRVKIPKNLSKSELKESIRFILEDELLSESDQTHCVIIDKLSDSEASVAIVAPQKMQDWLNTLSEKNIKADAFYPDYFALPVMQDGWTIYQIDIRLLIRFNQTQGLSLPLSEFELLLKQILTNSFEKPNCFYLNRSIPSIEAFAKEQAIACKITEINYPNSENTPINLLQNGFKKINQQLKFQLSKVIFGLLLLLPGLVVTNDAVEYGYWHFQQSRSANQISKLYHQLYPDATEVIAPKLRIAAELKKLGGMSANAELIRLLKGLSLAWQNSPDTRLIELNWQNNAVNISVELPNFAALETLKSNLQEQGLTVQQQSADNQNNLIKARITLK